MKKRKTSSMATRVKSQPGRTSYGSGVRRHSGSMARQRTKSRGIGRWILLALLISVMSVYLMRNGAENFKRIFSKGQVEQIAEVEEEINQDTIEETVDPEETIEVIEENELEESDEYKNLQASLVPNDSTINEMTKWWDIKPLRDKAFKVRNIKISGNFSVSEELIREMLGEIEELPMSEINLEELETKIENHPRIKNAIISKIIPSTLTCRIEERKEFATIIVDGTPLGIDENGMILSLPPEGWDQYQPIITGFRGSAQEGKKLNDEKVIEALEWMKEAEKLPRVWNWLSEVYLDKDRLVLVGGDRGARVLTGDHAKHIQLASINAMLQQNGDVEKYGMLIDLTFPKFLILRPISG